MTFEEKLNNLPEVAVNEQFLRGKSNFLKNCLKKSTFFQKFAWKNRNFFTRIYDPPDFKPKPLH